MNYVAATEPAIDCPSVLRWETSGKHWELGSTTVGTAAALYLSLLYLFVDNINQTKPNTFIMAATDQIRQMVNFILQEAHEKANEIRVKVRFVELSKSWEFWIRSIVEDDDKDGKRTL